MSRTTAICLALLLAGILLHLLAPQLSMRHYDEASVRNVNLYELLIFLARLMCVFAATVFGVVWIRVGHRS
jgi:hypothetical protein